MDANRSVHSLSKVPSDNDTDLVLAEDYPPNISAIMLDDSSFLVP